MKDYSAQIKQEALSNEVSLGRESRVNRLGDFQKEYP
jgi:hypothetical protein